MPPLAESQAVFSSALLEPTRPVPADLHCHGAQAGKDRFAVYRNNVMVGLIEALGDAYPVVSRLVGDEFFRAMAGVFARAHPPTSAVMLDYGAGFAEWIAEFPPAASLPYLPDVARLERAWVEAYHSAEADPLAHPIAFEATKLTVHPAARLVRTVFPVLAIWHAHQRDGEPETMELSPGREILLVTRPDAEVQVCRIPAEAADLIDAVQSGEPRDTNDRGHLPMLYALGAFSASNAPA